MDGQRNEQTDNGQLTIRKAYLSFQLRWAKKSFNILYNRQPIEHGNRVVDDISHFEVCIIT